MLRRLPIAWQVMGLVALGVLLAAGAMIAITLGGPPPRQPPTELSVILQTLDGEQGLGPQRFDVQTVSELPEVENFAPSELLVRELAARSGLPVNRLRAWTSEPVMMLRDDLTADFIVARQEDAGAWTVVRRGPDRDLQRWQLVTFSTIAVVLLLILGLAWLAARRIVQPIRDLARAARSSHAGMAWTLEPPAGPPEIALARSELRDLHERNREQAKQRMAMLAAIAHDIGTPLARVAFRIEALPDDQREAAMSDIETIRLLMSDSLTLSRGWTGSVDQFDVTQVARSVVEGAVALGHDAVLIADGPCFIKGNALSIERMVQNLVDNAVRYGGNAEVRMGCDEATIWLDVADKGPGFPETGREQLLRPFVRGEASRNDELGGSGLGLAIVAQAVSQHGGTIVLGRGAGGGALVSIRLSAGI